PRLRRGALMNAADLVALGAATLGESGGAAMEPRIRAAWSGAAVAGPAFTARCPDGDNLAIHVAVTRAPAGSVLVVDASDRPALGYWGEVLTTAAEARDVAGLEAHAFPVFSALIALPGASKTGPGTVDQPVTVGGVGIAPGDWVVAD